MIGRIFSHYRILEQIGGGGMGVVYKAEDTRLMRPVALKFLPPELSRDPDTKQRFLQEAQAASSLQHNNICTVHEIDEADDGQLFIVMDLYEGETLAGKIGRGALPVAESAAIASQIAQGIAAAHAKGILHRDIKPANILLTRDGTVKIVDFGLAKLSGRALMTSIGSTLGTTAYMSPEQTRGEEADGRTDIWSLGVLLYQMLSGRLPFGWEHEQAVIYNIQNVEPPPIESLRAELPAPCTTVVRRALKKDPAERYPTMNEMLHALEGVREGGNSGRNAAASIPQADSRKRKFIIALAGAALLVATAVFFLFGHGTGSNTVNEAGTPSLRRLAVLPFANLRSDPQTDFLGFALADQIIGHLAYVKTILVRPSVAIRQYQNQTVDAASAAKALNVDYLLTGNYLKESDVVRLSLELVDIRTNGIIWRESIEESYVNAFKLEDLVSEKVVSGLQVKFSADERQHMQADVSRNPKAYELFLRAVASPTAIEGTRRGAALIMQSLALDSTYAPAYSELGYRLQQIANYVPGEQHQVTAAEQAYQKALALNPGSLAAMAGLSSLYTDIGKTGEAFELAQQAIAVNPNNGENHFFLGYVYRYVGLMDDAVLEMERAVALDPGNPRFRSIGITYTYRGEYEKALRGFDLDGDSPYSNAWRAFVYMLMRDTVRSLGSSDRVSAVEPKSVIGLFSGTLRAYLSGRIDSARSLLKERDRIHAVDGEQLYNMAEEAALLGDTARCELWLRNAIEGGFFNYPLMLRDPFLDPVRNDPTIQNLFGEARMKREAFMKRYKPGY